MQNDLLHIGFPLKRKQEKHDYKWFDVESKTGMFSLSDLDMKYIYAISIHPYVPYTYAVYESIIFMRFINV